MYRKRENIGHLSHGKNINASGSRVSVVPYWEGKESVVGDLGMGCEEKERDEEKSSLGTLL